MSDAALAWQADFLGHAQSRGGWSSFSLAAACSEHGHHVTADCARGWTSGRRMAPLFLLRPLIAHSRDRAGVADLLVRDFGLRVVVEQVAVGDPLSEVLDAVQAAGEALGRVREDGADGRIDEQATIDALQRLVAEATEALAAARAAMVAPRRRAG